MNTNVKVLLIVLLSTISAGWLLLAQQAGALASEENNPDATSQWDTVTNLPPGMVSMVVPPPVPPAVPLPVPEVAGLKGIPIPSSAVSREIRPGPEGAIADFGRSTILFGPDVAATPAVTVLAPDGQRLSFTPTFVVLANRVTGENYLVADVAESTNCSGEITSASAVTYYGAFGTLADVRYEYDWVRNSLEQFVVLNETVPLPEGWSARDVRLEAWTEWLEGEPSAVNLSPMALRAAGVDGPEVEEADTEIHFGAMKVLGKGKAFSLGPEGIEISVCKTWVRTEADLQDEAQVAKGSGPARRFLVEAIDFLSAQPELEKLGKSGGHAALGPFKSPGKMLAGRELAGRRMPRKSGGPMQMASAPHPRNSGAYEIDFCLQGCYPAPLGLISLWQGETNGLDSVGTNHGTVVNVGYSASKVLNGFSFNGTGGVVSVSNSATLNFGAGADFSIEGWIKPETNTTEYGVQMIVDKRYAPSSAQALGYAFYLVNGTLGFQLSQNISNYQFTSYGPAGADLRGTNWHHVAVTVDRDAEDGLKIYTDGVLVRTFNPTNQAGDLTTTQPLLIGKHAQTGLNAGFKGGLDELTIYGRSLSSNEVFSIYSAGAAGKGFNYVCVPPPTNVVGWWPGDNSNADLGRGHPVTLYGGLGYGPGMVYRAFNFNASGTYAKISTNADLDIGPSGSGMTLEAWINSADATARPIMMWGSPTLTGVHLFQHFPRYGSVYVNFVDTSGATHNLTLYDLLTTNTPTHVAATYDKASGWVRLYFNGVKIEEYNWGSFTPSTATDFYLGYFPSGGVSFSGLLDEPTVYDRALTAIEVSSIWYAGSGGKCRGTPLPVDSDGDGLPDWWELQYFGNLSRTGSGDYDGDGVLDRGEYLNGTNPSAINTLSINVFEPKPANRIP